MSITGQNLLVGFSRLLGDYFASTTSGAGSTTTVVDTTLSRFADDALVERFFRITETGHSAIWEVRRCSDFTSSTGTATVAPAYGATSGASSAYEVHRWEPSDKFFALDEARLRAFPDVQILRLIDTITGDGISRVFDIPSTIRSGPVYVQVETPLSAQVDWNFLADPDGDSVSNYTATDTTASTVSRINGDWIVPKYGDTETKLVTAASQAATYTLPIANATNDLTAALAADREMAYCRWVYCTEASKVRLQITDDDATTSGSYHGGSGWELLTVEKTVVGNNATTLSAVVDIASTANASTIYVSRGWWYFGKAERVQDGHYLQAARKEVRRDDTTQKVYLDEIVPRGYQMRLIGYDSLSALGTTASTQVTNTMEIDAQQATILYAEAAKVLFQGLGFKTSRINDKLEQMGVAEQIKSDHKNTWGAQTDVSRIRSPWAR